MRLIDADVLKEMIPTTDVDFFENCRNCSLLYKEQVLELIDMTPTIDQWIPCSERLPKPNRHDELNVDVYYLAQTEFGDMIVASYNESHEGTKWWEQMYSYRIFDDEIVAWMPLPEPYKGARTSENNNRF